MKAGTRETLSVVITLTCDSECKHCYIDSLRNGEFPELTVAEWKSVLRKFRERGGMEFCVHGGEPLLYEGICELLQYAHHTGLGTSIITNAVHLNPTICETLSQCSTFTLVGLDGPKENYSSLRCSDQLEIVIRHIDMMLEFGVKIQPIQVIHRKNVHGLWWIADFCMSRNIPVATLSPIQPIGRASRLSEFLLTGQELHSFKRNLDALNQEHQGRAKFVTQSIYPPDEIDRYLNDENSLMHYEDGFYHALNDGKLTAHFLLSSPRDFILGGVFDLESIDDYAYAKFQQLLEAAFRKGLEDLRSGLAINWYEVIQRQERDWRTT